ncbi:hypothetical protein HDU92_000404, partial [Lobulomyces angularis]
MEKDTQTLTEKYEEELKLLKERLSNEINEKVKVEELLTCHKDFHENFAIEKSTVIQNLENSMVNLRENYQNEIALLKRNIDGITDEKLKAEELLKIHHDKKEIEISEKMISMQNLEKSMQTLTEKYEDELKVLKESLRIETDEKVKIQELLHCQKDTYEKDFDEKATVIQNLEKSRVTLSEKCDYEIKLLKERIDGITDEKVKIEELLNCQLDNKKKEISEKTDLIQNMEKDTQTLTEKYEEELKLLKERLSNETDEKVKVEELLTCHKDFHENFAIEKSTVMQNLENSMVNLKENYQNEIALLKRNIDGITDEKLKAEELLKIHHDKKEIEISEKMISMQNLEKNMQTLTEKYEDELKVLKERLRIETDEKVKIQELLHCQKDTYEKDFDEKATVIQNLEKSRVTLSEKYDYEIKLLKERIDGITVEKVKIEELLNSQLDNKKKEISE